jgi:hypothetical protein
LVLNKKVESLGILKQVRGEMKRRKREREKERKEIVTMLSSSFFFNYRGI